MIDFTDYYLLDRYYENGQFVHAFDPKALESINTVENPYAEISKSIYRSNVVEFWLPLTDNEVEGIDTNRYWISSFGNIWDYEYGKPLPIVCSKGNKFYQQVTLHTLYGTVVRKVHRLMMMKFTNIDNPEKYQVNHIDGNHSNNNLYNLEWCDDSYNRIHSIINGVGTNNFSYQITMLTPEIVHQIKVYREDMGYQTHKIYFELMPELQQIGSYDVFRHLIPKMAQGKSKLYSRYYI